MVAGVHPDHGQRLRDGLAGKAVALICSGGNVSPAQLRALFD